MYMNEAAHCNIAANAGSGPRAWHQTYAMKHLLNVRPCPDKKINSIESLQTSSIAMVENDKLQWHAKVSADA